MDHNSREINKPDEPAAQALALRVDWNGAAQELPLKHANQMIVQVYNGELFVSFFALSPPVTLGAPDNQIRQPENAESLRPECVARLVITPEFARETIRSLQEQLTKMEGATEDNPLASLAGAFGGELWETVQQHVERQRQQDLDALAEQAG